MPNQQDVENAVTALEAEIERDTTVDGSIKTALLGWQKLYADALASGGNPAAIIARVQAVSDAMKARVDSNVEFVKANTPIEPA